MFGLTSHAGDVVGYERLEFGLHLDGLWLVPAGREEGDATLGNRDG
jgi:hypothetical protein